MCDMKLQEKSLTHKLFKAVELGLVSRPHMLPLPDATPFEAAVCTVSLPPACLPPESRVGLRVSSGTGPETETASFKALCEGAERYSIQYSTNMPSDLSPIVWAGRDSAAEATCDLTIGSSSKRTRSSRGSATGATIEDACQRAILECIESVLVSPNGQLRGDFQKISETTIPALQLHIDFLSSQARKIEIYLLELNRLFALCAVCSDLNGSRPTLGSAVSHDYEDGARRAVEESMLLWRNMIELERSGVVVADLPENDRKCLEIYRGLKSIPSTFDPLPSVAKLADPIEVLRAISGKNAKVFDLTSRELKIPVAKVHLMI